MAEKQLLFNKPIAESHNLTLSEQVYDILREEIYTGRWEIGDRLPSLTESANESGLSRWPIQKAFEMLREEGYIVQKSGSGSHLSSVLPKGHNPSGAIGVAILLEEAPRLRTSHVRLHHILDVAAGRNYTVEPLYLRVDDDWESIDTKGAAFSDRVKGVISLHAFPRECAIDLPASKLPMVFISNYPDDYCMPRICGDIISGYYHLTQKVIEAGHRNIICCYDPRFDKREASIYIKGHKAAMEEAGLTFNTTAYERSLLIPEGDLRAMDAFLDEFSYATALIPLTGEMARTIVAVADVKKIRIPEDLSIVCHGPGPMRLREPGKMFNRCDFNQKGITEMAFDMLFKQMETGKTPFNHLIVPPHVFEGESLAPPIRKTYVLVQNESAEQHSSQIRSESLNEKVIKRVQNNL